MKNETVLPLYVSIISRLSGCFQFVRLSENNDGGDESDDEEIEDNMFKAAEQEVLPLKTY